MTKVFHFTIKNRISLLLRFLNDVFEKTKFRNYENFFTYTIYRISMVTSFIIKFLIYFIFLCLLHGKKDFAEVS